MSNLVPSFLEGLIIFAGNKDNHKSLDEFEFMLDPSSNY